MQPSCHFDPKLGEETPDHIHELGALLDQQVTSPVQRQRRLLLGRFHRHETHRRRVTASQIASASLASVLPRFTYGFT